jgi:uncharacterized protein (TIGR02444 family)
MADADEKSTVAGSPFWRFSLAFYRRRGVADACIAVQEQSGVDVNLLLYLLWQASQARALTAHEVAALDEQIAPWRLAAVIPLRAVRRALKDPPALVAGAAAEAFRNRIKAVELEAERLQQEAMYQIAPARSGHNTAVPADAAARANLAAYETILGAPLSPPAVEVLLESFVAMNTGG